MSSTTVGSPPPPAVLAAFGVRGTPTSLGGGRGRAWQADDLVIKPAETGEAALVWQADVLDQVRTDGVRVARPRRSVAGPFIVAGWSASTFEPGRHEPRRWSDIVAVGRRLHGAWAQVDRPDFLDGRVDRWAVADRAAWGETSLEPFRDVPHVTRLEDRLEPVRAASQLIHGDLAGNVLFASRLPPAVIDLSAYWRPAEFATAIVAADALTWEGAEAVDLASAVETDQFGQLLARAVLYRIVADALAGPAPRDVLGAAYAPAVDLAVRLIEDGR